MGVRWKTFAFDVVERRDVPQPEVDRLAQRTWQSMSADIQGSSERPRWVNSGPVADADAFLVHRYEGSASD